MAESQAHRRWTNENTVHISIRLQKKGDADILSYFEGKNRQAIIKQALREYMSARMAQGDMERHKEEDNENT